MSSPVQILCLSAIFPSYEKDLVDHDMTCLHCPTLEHFKNILETGTVDLVLSDLSLPDLDLRKILELIRAENLDLPVIAVLDSFREEEISKLIHAGASDCIGANQMAHLKAAIHREVRNLKLKRDLQKLRLEDVRSISGRLAHDFNNILAPIAMSAPMLKWEIEDEEYNDIIDTLEQSVRNGTEMIRDLLVFGRGIQLHRSDIKIEDLITEVAGEFRKELPENIHLEIRTEKDLPLVSCDPEKLEQVLMHLLTNAKEAMSRGGTIEIAAAKEYGGEDVQIFVQDQGEGIEPKSLALIFDPFFSTKRNLKRGAGLGLSLALGIIKSHGGSISVSSRLGEGSRFRINLPGKAT